MSTTRRRQRGIVETLIDDVLGEMLERDGSALVSELVAQLPRRFVALPDEQRMLGLVELVFCAVGRHLESRTRVEAEDLVPLQSAEGPKLFPWSPERAEQRRPWGIRDS